MTQRQRTSTQEPGNGSHNHALFEPPRVIELATGVLTVNLHNSDLPIDELCGFASRRNPKRGFLFVSKVLGKHIPAKPSVIRDIHTRLAAKIPHLPGPVVVVGMAETAICLGHGVFDEYRRLTGRDDVMFIHSTRYLLERPMALQFLEEHSHAADHIIYSPVDPIAARIWGAARSLVLVDDEASTGNTFVNLVRAFLDRMPQVEQVVTAVITDWRGPQRTEQTHSAMPIPCTAINVLAGQYSFTAAPDLALIDLPKAIGNGQQKDSLIRDNYGRLGLVDRLPEQAAVPSAFRYRGGRHLVLGTGEFAYPPFLLAEELERSGLDVRYQATTRSPIIQGGAIQAAITFPDNYDDGIDNHLYNARAEEYDRVIVGHETPDETIHPDLVRPLGAERLRFVL